jgi:hypothetical protein
MRCSECGEAVEKFQRHCQACGAGLGPSILDERRDFQEGVPVVRYVPAPSGPPVVPDPLLPRPWPSKPTSIKRHAPLTRGAITAAPCRPPGDGLRLGLVLLASAVMMLVLWQPGLPALASLVALTAIPRPTTSGCPVPHAAASAARAITAVQLVTRLRDPTHGDYRPVGLNGPVQSGQTAYLTFRITTNASGTVAVLFCTRAGHIRGTLSVPAGSDERYGEFSAAFARDDTGPGVAVVDWNGEVAAALSFVVSQAQ